MIASRTPRRHPVLRSPRTPDRARDVTVRRARLHRAALLVPVAAAVLGAVIVAFGLRARPAAETVQAGAEQPASAELAA